MYIPLQNVTTPTLMFAILKYHSAFYKAVSWLMRLGKVASFQASGSVPGDLLWDSWRANGLSLSFSGFPLLNFIPPLLHTYLSPPPDVCYSHNHAAQYHNLKSLTANFLSSFYGIKTDPFKGVTLRRPFLTLIGSLRDPVPTTPSLYQ